MNIQQRAVMANWLSLSKLFWFELAYSNCTNNLAICKSKAVKILYSNDAWMFFVTPHLRDSRDLSSYRRPKYLTATRFQTSLNIYLKSREITGTIAGARFSESSLDFVKDRARDLWLSLDTDLSHTLYDLSLIDNDESWKLILSATIDPNSTYYLEAGSDLFFRDYQAISFLRKFEGFVFKDVDPELNALNKWVEAERMCAETNERFLSSTNFSQDEYSYLRAIKLTIQKILGPSPSLSDIRKNLRVGPGASASCASGFTSILDKIDQVKTVSTRSASVVTHILKGSPFEFICDRLVVSKCTRLAFVPKKWDIYRPIEIPEDIDMLCQLSCGSLMRSRLKKYGLDLDTQASRNGELARLGSISNLVMTKDLTSASDTIAYRLVEALLPKGWFNILSRFRSPFVSYEKSDVKGTFMWRNEKFSAMGNGFTFELESLIFLAITLVACGKQHEKRLPDTIGVFGDDICCPVEADFLLDYLLDMCGFIPNIEKSFSHGPFRESCGQDFFLGAPVRPYFQKKDINDVTSLYIMANGLRRSSVRSTYNVYSDLRYGDVWKTIVNHIPTELRVFGPESLGDSVIWGNPEDGIDGEWPINSNQSWTYKTGPATLIQRGLNLFAYSGSTLITAWGLVKGDFIKDPFEKPTPLLVSRRPCGKDVYRLRTASLVPRTLRRNSYKSRFKRSTFVFSIKSDCPAFQ